MSELTSAQHRGIWIRGISKLIGDMLATISAVKYLVQSEAKLGEGYEDEEDQILRLCEEAEDIVAHIRTLTALIEEKG
ncbi:hypothetical protein ES708_32659 [subsurface metagenome]